MTDQAILDLILFHEGSAFTDDPQDPGGPTRWGVTIGTLSDWLGRPATVDEVVHLTRETAEAIYRERYIQPFDLLPDPLRANVIDFGVNAGVLRAIVMLQKAVGAEVTGLMSPDTLTLVEDMDVREPLNEIYTGMRLAYYENLVAAKPAMRKYRRGWRARALSFTSQMHKRVPPPSPEQSLVMAKADATEGTTA